MKLKNNNKNKVIFTYKHLKIHLHSTFVFT